MAAGVRKPTQERTLSHRPVIRRGTVRDLRSGVDAAAGGPRTEFPDAVIAEEQCISAVATIEPASIERCKVCQGRAGLVTAVRCRVVEQDVRGVPGGDGQAAKSCHACKTLFL